MALGTVKRGAGGLAGALVEAAKNFGAQQPFQLAAALSYYTLLSMAPLLLVITGVVGVLLGQTSVQQELIEQMRQLVGQDGAELMQTVIANAEGPDRGVWSMIIGGTLTLLGATTVFAQLQNALNRCWEVEPAPRNAVVGFLRARTTSFGVLLAVGFLLLVSLVLSAVLAALYDYIDQYLFGAAVLWRILNAAVSLALLTVLIAALLKFVPDADIEWRDTWIGALCTAVLMSLGKFAIGLYLGQASVGSAYGAAGSALVLMVWVYYAALILFFGAVLTRAIARRRGAPVQPSRFARRIDAVDERSASKDQADSAAAEVS